MSNTSLNETHDPALRSWVESANGAGCDFPVQNLPFAVFRTRADDAWRGGVAIGDCVVDLAAVTRAALLDGVARDAGAIAAGTTLNALMALGPPASAALRLGLSRALRADAPRADAWSRCLVAQAQAELALPARIGDYTDFYTSIHHATNVGKLFRPDQPLLPNYKWIPIGYHGRSSSIGVSGQRFHRPIGQTRAPEAESPVVGPSSRLDYELELGIFVGAPNALGEPVPLDAAEAHVFGLCLLNDWSARDLQAWEYQPLGPFLAKNFASTISPWIVTVEALAPFRSAWTRDAADPQPLPYLDSEHHRAHGAMDIQLEVLLQTAQMRSAGAQPERVSLCNYRHAYWTVAQMLAHHTMNGCNLQAGDLIGSGTQSGPQPGSLGSLLELTQGGKQPITLASGERRTFLEDGDTVVMRAWCERPGAVRIGFGEVAGTVLPARAANAAVTP